MHIMRYAVREEQEPRYFTERWLVAQPYHIQHGFIALLRMPRLVKSNTPVVRPIDAFITIW